MTPYEEIATPADLHADCEAVSRALGLAGDHPLPQDAPVAPDPRLAKAAAQAMKPTPSIHFDEYPREIPKGQIEVTEAAQRLANALHLHLD